MLINHLLLALLSTAAIWMLSGILINATDRVSRRFRKPGFAIAFIMLGFLTSISEISVAVNSTVQGVPQVSAGNLVGASVVIFLLLLPILCIAGGGVDTSTALRPRSLALLLFVVLLPSLLALDGTMTRTEGVMMLVLYLTLLYIVQKRRPSQEVVQEVVQRVHAELTSTRGGMLTDIMKITFAGVLIFVSGKVLVDEAVFFSQLLQIPPSFVGLIVLSIGTNAPELTIALRGIMGRHKDIAYGDYLGSAAANTPILGMLTLANGNFILEKSEFLPAFILLTIGLTLFFFFARSRGLLSRREGWILLSVYVVFVTAQMANVIRIAPQAEGHDTQVEAVAE
jgi:cation:H+ antiporter